MKLNTNKQVLILISTFLLIFSSCQDDLQDNLSQNNSNPVIKEYSFKELNQTLNFSKSYNQFRKDYDKLRARKRSISDIVIDSSLVKVIELDGQTTYTMAIANDSINPTSFENLIVQTFATDSIKAYVIKYTINSDIIYLPEHDSYSLDTTGTLEELDLTNSTSQKSDSNCYTAYYCDYEGTHPAGKKCEKKYPKQVCAANNSSGGGAIIIGIPGGTTTGGTGTTTGGTANTTSGTSSTSTGTYSSGGVPTSTVYPTDLTPYKSPCEKIKSNTSSTQYMNSFNNINKPEVLAYDYEYGFAQINDNYVFSRATGGKSIPIPKGSKNYTHTHPNKKMIDDNGIPYNGNVKIHSPDDIYKLIVECQRNNGTDPTNAFGVAISDEGIYALTILEPLILDYNLQMMWPNFEQQYKNLSTKIIADTMEANEIGNRKVRMQKMLLNLLKDLGLENKIGLFEGTVDNSGSAPKINWQRKKSDASGNLIPENC